MAIAVGSTSNTPTYGNRTNSTITAPSSISNGNLLVAILHAGNSAGTAVSVSAPAGFTEVTNSPVSQTYGGYTIASHVYYKVASGESGNYTFSHTTADTEGYMYRLTGADTSTPIDVTPATSVANLSNNGTTTALASITTGSAGAFIIAQDSAWDGPGSGDWDGTTPTLVVRRQGSISKLYDAIQSSAGATGARTRTNGNTGGGDLPWVSIVVAIRPASAATNVSVNATGSAATGSVGTATANGKASVSVTGQANTSALGTVTASGGGAGPFALVNAYSTTYDRDPGSAVTKTTSSFSAVAGDILVVVGSTEASNEPIASISGGSLTWTTKESVVQTDYCYAGLWTATVDSNKTMTVSALGPPGNNIGFGITVYQYRGASGLGASSNSFGSGAPSLSVTTSAANSAIAGLVADWNADDGTTRTWRTINGITPTNGNGLEKSYFRDASAFTSYSAHYNDAGTIATKTYGLTAPTGQKYTAVGIEILKGTDSNASVSVTGQAANASLGTVTIRNSYAQTATGTAATPALGAVSVSTQQRVSPTGLSGTSALGTVTLSLGGGVSVSATGNVATSAIGTVSAGNSSLVSVTGNAATGSLGTVTVNYGTRVSVTMSALATSIGTPVVRVSSAVSVTGLASTSSVGSVTVQGIGGIEVLGLQASTALSNASIDVKSDAVISVTGVNATGSVGTVRALDPVVGQQMLGFVGTVGISFDTAFVVDGLEMSTGTSYPFLPQWAQIPDSIPNVWIEIT